MVANIKLLYLFSYLTLLDPCWGSSDTRTKSLAVRIPSLPTPCNATDVAVRMTDCSKKDQTVVSHGHTCRVTGRHRNTTDVITCWDGIWIGTKEVRLHKRQANQNASAPRQPGDLMLETIGIGTSVGAAFGPVGAAIGAGVGAIVGFFCELFCPHSDPPPPNRPPTISWNHPSTTVYFADPGETTKVVKWDAPTASDPEDGNVNKVMLVTGKASGSAFSRGSHTITYQARDSGGLIDSKYYSFEVQVHVCKTPLQWPGHGFIQCGNPERIAGSTCTYSCFEGFRLNGDAHRKCKIDGSFSGQAAQCKAVTCPRNSSNIHPSHGNYTCTDSTFEYNDVCATRCDKGYSLPSDSFKMAKCTSRGTWSTTLPPCQDAEPPEITDCPTTINAYADRGQTYASVTWTVPSGKDNSGGIVTVRQTVGKSSGSHFDVGINEIRYIATDSTGNKSPECIFFVIVELLQCGPPVIQNPYVVITCPNGYTFGSSCTVSCRGSYPLIGNDKMYCDRNSTNPKLTYWNWGSSTPYCKQNKCPLLTAPAHGALTCDKWTYGFQCMLHCNDHYDIPAGAGGGSVARFTGQFSCSTSSGKWSPVDAVPDCSVRRNPKNFVLPGEVYYYSGSCSDKATQDTIKAHFIQEMQQLQTDPGHQGICPNANDCNVQNVEVLCGTTRRRRGAMYARRYRRAQPSTILLTFEIQLQWRNIGNSSSDNYQSFDNLAKKLGSMIQAKASSGSFDVANSSVDTSSLQFGQLGIECEQGRYPRLSTGTCASCPLGSIYDATTRQCTLCPKGMYRDDDNDVTCSPCPPGTSTHTNGTTNATECTPICKKGFYSLDGVEPCAPCSRLEYGPNLMATKCEKCERGLMTNSSASTQPSDCLAFDVAIPGGTLLTTVGSLKNDITSFTLASWVKLPKVGDVNLHVSIGTAAQKLMIDFGQQVNISLQSSSKTTGVMIKRGIWQHVAVVWNSAATVLKVYVQGTEQFTTHLTTVTVGAITAPSGADLALSCDGPTSTVGHISGFLLKASVLSITDIKTLTTTCYNTEIGEFEMSHLLETEVDGLDLISPSSCDAKDDCDPDPCNGHICIDGMKTFTCHCTNGYTGDTCQVPPDYCRNHKCENGATCHNMHANYTCSCSAGFKGQFCESKIVDGKFGPWGEWSQCSKSCAGGQMMRIRECDSPAPDPDGKPCIGHATETDACNTNACPVCPPTPHSYGSRMSCNSSDDMITCKASCRDGMWFTPGFTPLDVYKCGKETAYQWNGKPPSCSRVYSPAQLETSTTLQYSSATSCQDPEKFKDALLQKSKEKLQCSHNKTCDILVSIEGCSSDRSKRSLSGVKAVITLRVPLVKGDNLNMEDIAKTSTVSPAMLKLLQSVGDLERSVQQLNTSQDILQFNVDGRTYNVLTVLSTSSVGCDKGKVRLEAICVDCPHGTYGTGRDTCLPCPYGEYQDQSGAETCKQCPKGLSTAFIGSSAQSDCSVAVPVEDEPTSDDNGDNRNLGVIIGCTVGAVMLCAVVLGVCIRNHLRSRARKSKMGSFASMNMVQSAKPPKNTYLA